MERSNGKRKRFFSEHPEDCDCEANQKSRCNKQDQSRSREEEDPRAGATRSTSRSRSIATQSNSSDSNRHSDGVSDDDFDEGDGGSVWWRTNPNFSNKEDDRDPQVERDRNLNAKLHQSSLQHRPGPYPQHTFAWHTTDKSVVLILEVGNLHGFGDNTFLVQLYGTEEGNPAKRYQWVTQATLTPRLQGYTHVSKNLIKWRNTVLLDWHKDAHDFQPIDLNQQVLEHILTEPLSIPTNSNSNSNGNTNGAGAGTGAGNLDNANGITQNGESETNVEWSCKVCTLLNPANRTNCTLCETRRFDVPSLPVDVAPWSCLKCTFLNKSVDTQCEVCSSDRIPTYASTMLTSNTTTSEPNSEPRDRIQPSNGNTPSSSVTQATLLSGANMTMAKSNGKGKEKAVAPTIPPNKTPTSSSLHTAISNGHTTNSNSTSNTAANTLHMNSTAGCVAPNQCGSHCECSDQNCDAAILTNLSDDALGRRFELSMKNHTNLWQEKVEERKLALYNLHSQRDQDVEHQRNATLHAITFYSDRTLTRKMRKDIVQNE